jgi:hypothetical protein
MPVTQPNLLFSIANLNPDLEVRARQFDADQDGFLTLDEAVSFYRADSGGYEVPNLGELFQFLGREQNDMDAAIISNWEVLNAYWEAPNFKGDFRLNDFTDDPNYKPAGNVRNGRRNRLIWEGNNPRNVDQTLFFVDFNLMKRDDFDGKIKSATLVVAPRGFPAEAGSALAEKVPVPMTAHSESGRPGFWTSTRGGAPYWVPEQPEKKFFAAAVDTEDLRALSDRFGGNGLEYYFRLEVHGRNRPVYVNLDGAAGKNFGLSAEELAARDPV